MTTDTTINDEILNKFGETVLPNLKEKELELKLKLIEELFELGEALTKSITKGKTGHTISDAKLIEECGDVAARLGIFLGYKGDDFVTQCELRADEKIKYILNNLYKEYISSQKQGSLTEDEGKEQ